MTAWRDVEVAAAEALDGPTAGRARRHPRRTLHRRGGEGARAGHGPRRGRLRRRARRLGRPGGALDPLRADLLRRARHRARAAAAARRGARRAGGAAAAPSPLAERAREHADTLCVGRTHGVHAEPTSFGLKLAGFAFEAHRNADRLERAFAQAATGAISGAVGTYASLGPAYERRVLAALGLAARARLHAGRAARPARRARAGDRPGRAPGSSGSPRRCATSSARRCARSRSRSAPGRRARARCRTSATRSSRSGSRGWPALLRGYAQAAVEDVALWHERDISHSGAERVLLPDATIVLDYAQHLALRVVEGMTVHTDRMRANLELTCGALFSQRILLALVDAGMQRDDAYRIVQRLAQQAWDTRTPLRGAARARAGAAGARPRRDLRLRPLHAPRPRGAGATRGDQMTDALLLHGAPEPRRTSSTPSRRASSTRSSTWRPTAGGRPRSACWTPTRCARTGSRCSTRPRSGPTS